MDIWELSKKMEADLLESHINKSDPEPQLNNNFSPRVTRSQTNRNQVRHLVKEHEMNVQPKQTHRKVDEVEKLYLNKKTRVVHKNLETIYEDPIWKKGNTMLLGTNKIKRCIYLDREFRIKSKQKSKLRKMKIKRLGKRLKPLKMSHEEFMKKMSRIENFLNGDDVESQCRNENCDVEFFNCGNNEKSNDLQTNDTSGINSTGIKELDMGDAALSE